MKFRAKFEVVQLYSTVGRLEEFIVETFRVKPSSDFSRLDFHQTAAGKVEPTSVSAFHRRLLKLHR